jgi:hypothetical protein
MSPYRLPIGINALALLAKDDTVATRTMSPYFHHNTHYESVLRMQQPGEGRTSRSRYHPV